MAKKSCPRGQAACPQVSLEARYCPVCAYLYPLEVGAHIGDYEVCAIQPFQDRLFYLVTDAHGEQKVLAEVPELIHPYKREALIQLVLARRNELGLPLENCFLLEVQGLPLLYTRYPAFIWDALSNSVSQVIRQAGLLDFAQMAQVYQAMRDYWLRFANLRLSNPGLTLTNLVWASDGEIYLIDWEFMVPDNDFLQYPKFYAGYHQPILYEAERFQNYNIKIAMAGIYSSFIELVTGLNPNLWSPEMARLDFIRPMLSPAFLSRFGGYLQSLNPLDLPDELLPPLRSSAVGRRLQSANQYFYQGYEAFQQRQWLAAIQAFQQALDTQQTPFSQAWLGLATAETGKIIQGLQLLAIAEKQLPLARFAYERGRLLERLGQRQKAIKALHEATTLLPIYADAYYELSQLYRSERQTFDQAEACLKKAMEIHHHPRYTQALRSLYQEHGLDLEAESISTGGMQGAVKVEKSFDVESRQPKVRCSMGHVSYLNAATECPNCQSSLLWEPGTWVNDNTYEILSVLRKKDYASGKIDTLYLGRDRDQNKVVLKQIDLSYQGYNAYHREQQLMASLEHPVLPTLLDHFYDNACYGVLVYPFYPGVTLQNLMEQRPCLGEVQIYQVLRALGATLIFLQSSYPAVIHGDLKPANILIGDDGHIRLLDWSSVQLLDAAHTHADFNTTVPYAPPEFSLNYQLHPSFDFYALGITLIHAATGIYPQLFFDYSKNEVTGWEDYALHLSPALRKLLQGLVKGNPQERIRWTLDTLLAWLQDHRPQTTTSHSPSEQRQMAHLMVQLATCQDVDLGFDLIRQLLALRGNYLTFYTAAFHAYRLGSVNQAYHFLQSALISKPELVQGHWLLAKIHGDKGNDGAALHVLNRSLEVCDHRPETYQLMADIYHRLNQPLLMHAALEKTVKYAPGQPEYRLTLAQYYAQIHNYQKARDLCHELLDNSLASLFRGRVTHTLGAIEAALAHPGTALRYLHQALSLRPEDPLVHYDLGLLYSKMERFADAAKHFYTCHRLMPEHEQAYTQFKACQERLASHQVSVQ
jgi:serine/threonine protein kinase